MSSARRPHGCFASFKLVPGSSRGDLHVMATLLRFQVGFRSNTGVPRDVIQNTWHCWSEAVDPLDDAAGFFTDLEGFYHSVDGQYSSRLNGVADVKVYDLTHIEPRAPILTTTLSITPAAGFALPNECAICLSFEGPPLSGQPAQRRRGRVYLGPWDASTVDDGTGDAIVDSAYTALISGAAQTLMEAGEGETWTWSVFSPTTAGAAPWTDVVLAIATSFVASGWVDNAFDTVRSRGADATLRSTFP